MTGTGAVAGRVGASGGAWHSSGATPIGPGGTAAGGSSARGGTSSTSRGGTSSGGTTTSSKGGAASGGTGVGGTSSSARGGATYGGIGSTTTGGSSFSATGGNASGGATPPPEGGVTNAGGQPAGGATSPTQGGTPAGGAGLGGAQTTLPNQPPVISDVTLLPYQPRCWETVWVNIVASDPEYDSIFYTYVWTVNGNAIGGNYSVLHGYNFKKGDVIRVTVTPSDGKSAGTAVTSAGVVVANSPPEIYGMPALNPPDVADPDTPLICQLDAYHYNDPDSDTITLDYRWYNNGSLTVNKEQTLPAAVTALGDQWECLVFISDGTNGMESAFTSATWIATPVKGIIRSDTTWVAANSPYFLTDRIQLASGATLKIEPGVTVIGNSQNLEVWGNVSMAGTKENPIRIQDLYVYDYSTSATRGKFEAAYAQFDNGSINVANASFGLTDCNLDNLGIYLDVGASVPQPVERNVFRDCWGLQSSVALVLINNVFGGSSAYSTYVNVLDSLVAKNNSFLEGPDTVVALGSEDADLRNNYWGGVTDTQIPNYIYDNDDDLNVPGAAEYLPTLASSHPDTPALGRTYAK